MASNKLEYYTNGQTLSYHAFMNILTGNRGVLWYNTLTSEQQQELNIWYQAWLDVPQVYQETKPTNIETIIPQKPSWLI